MDHELANDATINHATQAAIHGGKKGHSLFQSLMKKFTG